MVNAGERHPFILSWFPSYRLPETCITDPIAAVEKTLRWWKGWSSHCQFEGRLRELTMRSLLTLKALTFQPTGGIVAAPTTSLPEIIGGERNWDYRLCWVRDATYTLYSLLTAGYRSEAVSWWKWLVRAAAGTPAQVNVIYGLAGQRWLPELTLDWLGGYEGSKPVRIGNAAYKQLQLDIFGEIMDASYLAVKGGLPLDEPAWNIQLHLLDHLEGIWRDPDEGIWEFRSARRQFTHSKVMAWLSFDRAIKIAEMTERKYPSEKWKRLRDEIHADVCHRGYDPELGCFVQAYGEKNLDASLLLLPMVGFLPIDDVRIRNTVVAIENYLIQDGLVRRYQNESVEDGLVGSEGSFLACSFWLADVYILMGRRAEAERLFERLHSLASDVGLYAEEYDVKAKRQTGNFPQAFTHIALINTAVRLFSEGAQVARVPDGTLGLIDESHSERISDTPSRKAV